MLVTDDTPGVFRSASTMAARGSRELAANNSPGGRQVRIRNSPEA